MLKLNRRFACGLMHFIKPVLLSCLLFIADKNYGQDTVALRAVEVNAVKISLSQIGKKTETIDSTHKDQFKFNSVGDLLNYNSAVFIKNYGPGAIATTAFRGGNASQTAILWNGFNLQNAMLGQADLSLMPAMLFDQVNIEYGGGSSVWGSGAMGGSIHLNNNTPFAKGLFTAVNLAAGSFGSGSGSGTILISKKRFITSTRFYVNASNNTFNYKDSLENENSVKQQKNAAYNFKGVLQEFKFLINPKQILQVNAWINSNQRRLPAFNPQAESKTYQEDKSVRVTANWTFVKTSFKSLIKAGFFEDVINYDDSLIALYSKSRSGTFMIENENYFDWFKNQQFSFSVSFLSSTARTSNYESIKGISRTSVLAGNKSSFFKNRLLACVSFRGDYFSVGSLPFTGNASLEYKLSRHIYVKANTARVYRQPTLNELYWMPGGNRDLEAEQGYTFETEINYHKQIKHLSVFISGAAYSRKIDNWILWVPGENNNPTPVNIQEVWSRGTETTWKLNYVKNKFKAGVSVLSSYVLSTVEANKQESSNTLNKQLIYTPRYTGNAILSLGYDKSELVFYHQYCGYRFIASDNTQWLNPYQVSSLRTNYTQAFKKVKCIFYLACNNLFNTNYAVLAGRPMALRNFEMGITLQTTKN